MGAEDALRMTVFEWVQHRVHADRGVAEEAVDVAVSWYRSGATVADACEQARCLVGQH